MKKFFPPFITLIVLTVFFEAAVRLELIPETLLPAPSSVFTTLIFLKNDYVSAFNETFLNVLAGLSLSIFSGTVIAFVFSLSDLTKRAILPFAVFFQTVPIIAVAPLLVIYLGFGAPTVIASSFIVSLFPIIANTLLGLENYTAGQADLFKLYKASAWQKLIKLQLPQAYAHIYSGLKVAAGLSIIGAIAGEFVAGGGLGALIDSARTQQRVDIVFGAILLLSLMGLLFIASLGLANKIILPKRPYMNFEQK